MTTDKPDRNRVPIDAVIALVEKSCAAQGVPFKITDPIAIAKIAPMFTAPLTPTEIRERNARLEWAARRERRRASRTLKSELAQTESSTIGMQR